jgi:hypothetical protein
MSKESKWLATRRVEAGTNNANARSLRCWLALEKMI